MELLNIFGKKRKVSPKRVNWNGPTKSKVQSSVKSFFYQYWHSDFCAEEFPVLGTKLSCDLINFDKKIAVETDGTFHYKYSEFHHKNRNGFINSINRDDTKEKWLSKNGFTVIRISEKEVGLLSKEFIFDRFGVDIENVA
jgi:hypothetical protein